ncbi:protein mono-ADP-ribosyltransferase PARP4-like isoform X3 [Dendronephthya gigantea]|uniref:protein mono-ADP-ribosyltransferase PARP4-like isoform X3 n=1 Tax=Dendronephthya gigantea TaxID=151771 RepID=UPI00106BDFFD|nr:protein mono-ADP-ribosyltransferase PARP4-like isoform X3 [Dendronephthya gigantea]
MVLFFKDCQFTVDFTSKHFAYKRKQEIRRNIVDHGGTISYILNNKTKYFVSENKEVDDTYKGRAALKLGIPIVSLSFIDDCAEQQKLLESDEYLTIGKSLANQFSSGIIKAASKTPNVSKQKTQKPLTLANLRATRVYRFNQDNESIPFFPSDDFEIVKHSWFKKSDKNGLFRFVAIELHISTAKEDEIDVEKSHPSHRIFSHSGILQKGIDVNEKPDKKECRFADNSDTAEQLYSLFCSQQQPEYRRQFSAFPPGVGSHKMISNNISSEVLNKENLSPPVKALVHSISSEAIGELSSLMCDPVERLKLEDISKAEGVLQAIREILDKGDASDENLGKYSQEFYSLVPHNKEYVKEITTKRVIAEKQDLCQLIKDILNVNEATNFSTRSSDEAKYKACGCHLESLSKTTDEYLNIVNKVLSSSTRNIKVQNIFSCQRPAESAHFQSHLGNIRQLFHSSKAQNFLGILSRGLLPPKIVVRDFGGERSDAGNLGTGIYFGSDATTSVKYSSPGKTRGTRLLLICEVALGRTKDFTEFTYDLEHAPDGYQSCHGVKNQPNSCPSEFEEDEYVVYSVNQQRIRYLVEFNLPEDDVKDVIIGDTVIGRESEDVLVEPTTAISLDDEAMSSSDEEEFAPNITTSDIEAVEDPLTKVKPGLRSDGDTLVPLKSVHIRAKLLDLCAKVVVMQVYENSNDKPIEAKYVFPLDDMAAVCGFEAFINGKHIVGEVKEKEQAHKEYKKAISEGHGAYLMDEETPDVFTVSVGNIPPGATVLIKITYVAELAVEDENIVFSLPGSLAPWSRDQALKESTQNILQSFQAGDDNSCDLSVQIAVEMPFDIRTLDCPTHAVRLKKTATKAVLEMKEGQKLDNGFQLLIGLAEIHVPRMWAERHPENADSQACMLSFYPEFEADQIENVEYIFLLDVSCSMKGTSIDNAKKIFLLALNKLPANARFNIVAFGNQWLELFPSSVEKTEKSLKEAAAFVKNRTSDMGATDLWKILRALSLLPVRSNVHVRNVCILSDGHVTETEMVLRLATSGFAQTRIFTFGVGSSANRYFLRTLAKVGAGASEYFDEKVKSKWKRKVESFISRSQQPVLTSVSVAWQQFDNDAPTPIQAPSQILSLFNGSRQVVYGFVPYCTQATLKAMINGKEISTMVSTSELSITSGSTLHQLTARALINDWEEGLLAPDHLHHQAVKVSRKDYIIEISKKYSVTSKFTSFVAIEKREEGETFDSTTAPDIDEILDGEDVDILGYIGFEEDDEESEGDSEDSEDESEEESLSSGDIDELLGAAHEPAYPGLMVRNFSPEFTDFDCSPRLYDSSGDEEIYGFGGGSSELCFDMDVEKCSLECSLVPPKERSLSPGFPIMNTFSTGHDFEDIYDIVPPRESSLSPRFPIINTFSTGHDVEELDDLPPDLVPPKERSLSPGFPIMNTFSTGHDFEDIYDIVPPRESSLSPRFPIINTFSTGHDVEELDDLPPDLGAPSGRSLSTEFPVMNTFSPDLHDDNDESKAEDMDFGLFSDDDDPRAKLRSKKSLRRGVPSRSAKEEGVASPPRPPPPVPSSTNAQTLDLHDDDDKSEGDDMCFDDVVDDPQAKLKLASLLGKIKSKKSLRRGVPSRGAKEEGVASLPPPVPSSRIAPTFEIVPDLRQTFGGGEISHSIRDEVLIPRSRSSAYGRSSLPDSAEQKKEEDVVSKNDTFGGFSFGIEQAQTAKQKPQEEQETPSPAAPPLPPKSGIRSRDPPLPPMPSSSFLRCYSASEPKALESLHSLKSKRSVKMASPTASPLRVESRHSPPPSPPSIYTPLSASSSIIPCYDASEAKDSSEEKKEEDGVSKNDTFGGFSFGIQQVQTDKQQPQEEQETPPLAAPRLFSKSPFSIAYRRRSFGILKTEEMESDSRRGFDGEAKPHLIRDEVPKNLRRPSYFKPSLPADSPEQKKKEDEVSVKDTFGGFSFGIQQVQTHRQQPQKEQEMPAGAAPPLLSKSPFSVSSPRQSLGAVKTKDSPKRRKKEDGVSENVVALSLSSQQVQTDKEQPQEEQETPSPAAPPLLPRSIESREPSPPPMARGSFRRCYSASKPKEKERLRKRAGRITHSINIPEMLSARKNMKPPVLVFLLQDENGSWNLTDSRLDNYLPVNASEIEKMLVDCGSKSLGVRTFKTLCKMVATLLVLAYLRQKKCFAFQIQLIPPFKTPECPVGSDTELHAKVAKAMTWLKTADRSVPCLCTRLQLGNNWEEVIPRLLTTFDRFERETKV